MLNVIHIILCRTRSVHALLDLCHYNWFIFYFFFVISYVKIRNKNKARFFFLQNTILRTHTLLHDNRQYIFALFNRQQFYYRCMWWFVRLSFLFFFFQKWLEIGSNFVFAFVFIFNWLLFRLFFTFQLGAVWTNTFKTFTYNVLCR